MNTGYELLFRRCNAVESAYIKNNLELPNGRSAHKIHGIAQRSDPDKWVSKTRKFADRYSPDGVDSDTYRFCCVLKVLPGTIDTLALERNEGMVKKGPRGAYGIPSDMLHWFNNRMIGVDTYDLKEGPLPKIEHETYAKLLRTNHGDIATFMAFSPLCLEYDNKVVSFSGMLNKNRMSWIKTSLLWMLWRSNWGNKEKQERIIQINAPEGYIDDLFDKAILSKKTVEGQEIIYQSDPDRKIAGNRWESGKNEFFVKAGKTTHFGVRGSAAKEYFEDYAPENMKDITEIVQEVLSHRIPRPTRTLFDRLELIQDYR